MTGCVSTWSIADCRDVGSMRHSCDDHSDRTWLDRRRTDRTLPRVSADRRPRCIKPDPHLGPYPVVAACSGLVLRAAYDQGAQKNELFFVRPHVVVELAHWPSTQDADAHDLGVPLSHAQHAGAQSFASAQLAPTTAVPVKPSAP